MDKDKIKKDLYKFCIENNIKTISASIIGKIIKEKKIYYHKKKIYHNVRIKKIKEQKN